jgi:cytoskeletal protein RodZ
MQRRIGLGVFLFANIMLVEFDFNMVSSFAMTSEIKSNCFLFRILNNIIFYIVLSIVFLIYLKVFKIDAQYEYRSEDISYSILLIS